MSKQGVNRVILIGNLGINPEEKTTANGRAVCNLRLATTESYKGQEHTEWHTVTVFGEQATACAKYLVKGRAVYIEGRLRSRTWVGKNQEKRYAVDVIADRVVFLGRDAEGAPPAEKPTTKPDGAENPAPWDKREDLPPVEGDDIPW